MRDISIVLNAVNVVMRIIEEEKERRDVSGLKKVLRMYIERNVGILVDTNKSRNEITRLIENQYSSSESSPNNSLKSVVSSS